MKKKNSLVILGPKKWRTKAGLLGSSKFVEAANPELALVFQVILIMSPRAATGIVLWRWFAGKHPM
jgi:hypothetical protein